MFNSRQASAGPDGIRHENERKLVGFDTETTGLWKPGQGDDVQEPISYSFVPYIDGKPLGRPISFLARPATPTLYGMHPAAIETHGWEPEMVDSAFRGDHVMHREIVDLGRGQSAVVRRTYQPAVDSESGIIRAAQLLGHFQRRGFTIVGANVKGFDIDMLHHHYRRLTNEPIQTSGFDPSTADIFDVIQNHWLMEGEPRKENGDQIRRRMSDPKVAPPYPKKRATLSDVYGVQPGDHTAEQDARTSVEIALRQIATQQRRDNGENVPFDYRGYQ